jgi:DNA-directed RNA polymerase subunit RPC12/RpoP
MKTAEWICTKCGVTNRKLVDSSHKEVIDKCVTCHAKHRVTEDDRPVRWQAASLK